MNQIDLIIIRVQAILTVLFFIGYFGILVMFQLGFAKIDPTFKDPYIALIGVLTAGIPGLLAFWFARSRASSANPTT